jgi:hypothetical protein
MLGLVYLNVGLVYLNDEAARFPNRVEWKHRSASRPLAEIAARPIKMLLALGLFVEDLRDEADDIARNTYQANAPNVVFIVRGCGVI